MDYPLAWFPLWGLALCVLVYAGVQSYLELKRRYNLHIETAKGVGWCYVWESGDKPNGIDAFLNLEMLNNGSEHCKIKPELVIVHSGSRLISKDLPIIDLDGNDPNRDTDNKYTARLTFPITVSHKDVGEEKLQATLILHCWDDRKWVFGRKTKYRHIELPYDQKLTLNIVF